MTTLLEKPSPKSVSPMGRFLVIAPFFPRSDQDPLIGGFINNPAYLWGRIAEAGHTVTVLTYGRPAGQWIYRRAQVISIGHIPFKGVAYSLFLEAKLCAALVRKRLYKNLVQIRIHQAGGLFLLFMRRTGLLDTPIVVTAHGTSQPEIAANAIANHKSPPFLVHISRWLQFWLEKILYRNADTLVSPSQFQVQELAQIYGVPEKKILVLPNGYDDSHYRRCPDLANKIRQRYGIADTDTVVLMVARAAPKKGFENFIKATQILSLQTHTLPFRFICVIGTPLHRRAEIDSASLEAQMPKSCILIHDVPEQELPAYYSTADLCVVPSIGYESVPSVVYEACACGCTVLASRLPGIEEVIDGPFLDLPNPEEIARRITEVLNQKIRTSFKRDYTLSCHLSKQIAIGQ